MVRRGVAVSSPQHGKGYRLSRRLSYRHPLHPGRQATHRFHHQGFHRQHCYRRRFLRPEGQGGGIEGMWCKGQYGRERERKRKQDHEWK